MSWDAVDKESLDLDSISRLGISVTTKVSLWRCRNFLGEQRDH